MPGDINEIGSARWKQRAFYDYLKDVYRLIENKPVCRFSIYEIVNNNSINTILKREKSIHYDSLYKLIIERIGMLPT